MHSYDRKGGRFYSRYSPSTMVVYFSKKLCDMNGSHRRFSCRKFNSLTKTCCSDQKEEEKKVTGECNKYHSSYLSLP